MSLLINEDKNRPLKMTSIKTKLVALNHTLREDIQDVTPASLLLSSKIEGLYEWITLVQDMSTERYLVIGAGEAGWWKGRALSYINPLINAVSAQHKDAVINIKNYILRA